jgi:hypothetical protein
MCTNLRFYESSNYKFILSKSAFSHLTLNNMIAKILKLSGEDFQIIKGFLNYAIFPNLHFNLSYVQMISPPPFFETPAVFTVFFTYDERTCSLHINNM